MVGCDEATGSIVAECGDDICPCTELGIRTAIAKGGGPYRFACDGPARVVTRATIFIDNDVILDGEGDLTVDGNEDHRVFFVTEGVTAELRDLSVTRGRSSAGLPDSGGGILNEGDLTLMNTTVSMNSASGSGGGIFNLGIGQLTLVNSTVSGNSSLERSGGGIANGGRLVLTNSTVSANSAAWSGGGIRNGWRLILVNSTVSGNSAALDGGGISTGDGEVILISSTVAGNTARGRGSAIEADYTESELRIELGRTLIEGDCDTYDDAGEGGSGGAGETYISWTSRGYNVQSPGDTCGLGDETDLAGTPLSELGLEPLGDYGGPTETHALRRGSVAVDLIPETACLDVGDEPLMTDQRGEPRPVGDGPRCDAGAFELQGAAQ